MRSLAASRRPSALIRALALVLLGVVLFTGLAVTAGTKQAWADPPPTPAPAPGVGVPDPGLPPSPDAPLPTPSPDPTPKTPKPTPSPIGPPPTATPSPAPPGTPSPAPGAPPPGGANSQDGTDGDPGLFDIPGQVRKAINGFVLWVAKTGLKPVLDALGNTVLSTPDLTANAQVKAIWTTSLVIANAVFVLFIIAGGFIVASRETLQSQYGFKEIAPRVVIAGVAANVSLIVCGKAIVAANALTAAIAGQGVDGATASAAIKQALDNAANGTNFLLSMLIIAALVMGIVVLITFIMRIALLVVLIGVAPLALTCHATPQTEGLAYGWWRALAACLGIQLGQAIIVLASVKVFLTPAGPTVLGLPKTNNGLLGVLICLTMLWLLIKLPGWTRTFVLGPLGRQHGRGLVGQIIHAVIMVKTLGALAGVSRGARSARSARSGPRPGTGPSPTGPTGPSVTGPTGGPRPARPTRPARPPRPVRPRTAPAPAGPAGFSNAPAMHTPLGQPAGTTAGPTFSNTPAAASAHPAPAGTAPAARFSHPTPTPSTQPPPASSRPGPTPFSNAPAPATPRRPAARPAPAPTFSAAPRPQTAPKRPPAPVTPVFSAPARPAPSGRTPPPRPVPSPSRPGPAVPVRSRRSDPPPRSASGPSVPPAPRPRPPRK